MASVNKFIIMGNLGADPELRYTPNGAPVCSISVATTRTWKNDAGAKQEKTEWHRVTLWNRLAEISAEYLKKGRPVYIEGRMEYGKYTNKDGVEMPTATVVAESLQLIGGQESGAPRQAGGSAPRAPAPAPRTSSAPPPASRPSTGFNDMDDDIPF
jgi:single-strand DNA-binding protein